MERLLILALAVGCSGVIGEGGPDGPGGGPTSDDPLERPIEGPPGPDDIRRLTSQEYTDTLTDLFGESVVAGASTALSTHPVDEDPHGFSTMAQEITVDHVSAYLSVADAIAATLVAQTADREALAPCLIDLADTSCIEGFIGGFGRRVYRHELSEEQASELMAAYADGASISPEAGFESLIVSLLMAPDFIYRLELEGEEEDEDDLVALTDVELATRLSYALWGTMPDQALLDAAETGALSSESGLEAEVDRLLSDPRAQTQVERFFREWLGYRHLPQVQQPDEFLADVERAGLTDAMTEELDWLVRTHVFERSTSYAGLLTSPLANPDDRLAPIYGVAPGPQDLEAATRGGLLTRAGLLVSSGESTSPIHRGVKVLEKLLCQELAPPTEEEAGMPIEPPPFDPDRSARDRWDAQTRGDACWSCHSAINPLGFAFEGYDTVGRVRSIEPIVDPDSGETVNELPVNDTVELQLSDETSVVDGAVEFGAVLAANVRAQHCFAEQWFRFTRGRFPSAGGDHRVVRRLAELTGEGDALLDVFRELVLSEEFRQRAIDVDGSDMEDEE